MQLKLLADYSQNKLIFAQAKKDFVDFLSSLCQMPIGHILKLMNPFEGNVEGLKKSYKSS